MPMLRSLVEQRDALHLIAARHGADHLRIFGSVARGDASPHDVDFLVTLEAGRSLLDHAALQQELAEFLGCPVDVVVEGGLSPYLKDRVLREAVTL